MQSNLLSEFYRSPASLTCFEVSEGQSLGPGFFTYYGVSCYGRSTSGRSEDPEVDRLYDLSNDCASQDCNLSLPFNPDEVAENFRRERYTRELWSSPWWATDLVRKAYYSLRPYLDIPLRRPLQRLYFGGWRHMRFPRWPVDTSVEQLCEKLMAKACQRGSNPIPFIWFWPDAAEGCVMMTHDVEEPQGRDFCTRLMDIDQAFGIPAAFQIVPEGRYTRPADFLDDMRCRGFEVNVQDLNHDGMLFRSRAEFVRRAALIDKYRQEFQAKGFRSAAMYRDLDWYEQLHFQYDMSVPNVAHLEPQRGGCCTVMPYFVGDLTELPLTTTQDYSLFHICREYSINLWKRQLELILTKNGLISFLVHPDYIRGTRECEVYVQLLRYLNYLRGNRNLWFALPEQVDEWWRQRSSMELVQEGGEWTVRHAGSERARLAYARLLDGNLVYDIQPKGVVIS